MVQCGLIKDGIWRSEILVVQMLPFNTESGVIILKERLAQSVENWTEKCDLVNVFGW